MFQARRMFKVISPIERRDGGGQYWLRCGNAYVNKDSSINVYIDALPMAGQKDGIKLQLRELTEEELRERAERRGTPGTRGAAGSVGGSGGMADSSPAGDGGAPF